MKDAGALGWAEVGNREAVLILIQAGCVLAIIAILEGVGRGRPGRP